MLRPSGTPIVIAERDASIRGVALWFRIEHPDGTCSIGKPLDIEWEHMPDDAASYGVAPTMRLRDPDLRAIVDGLGHAGMRAERDAKLAGELEATKNHLADARRMLGLDAGSSRTITVTTSEQ